MAIKKSELYSSLWAMCDALRGGMDASEYKNYVLVMLFVKYVSDKYAGVPYAPITVPAGASFKDMVALVGKPTIGDDINKKILSPLKEANHLSDFPDFNDATKLGSGKEQIDTLSKLILIFNKPELDFSKNRAEGDDILGDAYEYLMRHFATESGKSKGQFYTPSEVSRVLAKIIGINSKNTTGETTVYDAACGSGSLLLKVADEAEKRISLFGQEKETATAGLARMNMILHDNPSAKIWADNTLAKPYWENNGQLKTFDYCVANPPFSLKNWTSGVDTDNDKFGRFLHYGIPPEKNGDYAFLLHIIASLKSKGKGAIILPHGVLFRGGAEAAIREKLIRKGFVKGIIGLPANLFYGTGIPACIIMIDKENAEHRKGIFMVDAGKGFIKDGNKNRLRDQDLHKIVDVFNKQIEVPKYSRMVSVIEIEKNEFNLNLPRYIDSQEAEDVQDIEAHLLGDIPNADIDALENYWKVYPSLKKVLFTNSQRKNYSALKIAKDEIKQCIFTHAEFVNFKNEMDAVFADWKTRNTQLLKTIKAGVKPKQLIHTIAEDILSTYTNRNLLDKYDVYQHLMNYWSETMQDDIYLIAVDGWKAETYRILVKNKKGVDVDKGWTCDLVPPALVINRYFAADKKKIEKLQTELETAASQLQELEEEHSGEDGYFADYDKVNKANVQKRLKELTEKKIKPKKKEEEYRIAAEPEVNYGKPADEKEMLEKYLALAETQTKLNTEIKLAEYKLDNAVVKYYKQLEEAEIKTLVVDDKWMRAIETSVKTEMERISQRLTQRIKELAERYETPLPKQTSDVAALETKVNAHLTKMGFVWK